MAKIVYEALPGETAPPVPDGPVLCGADPEMAILHNAFLWGYEHVPRLIGEVAPGDAERRKLVGGWQLALDNSLHAHHHGEDTHMWDRLEQRAPACALHVGMMREHHRQVAEAIDPLPEKVSAWIDSGDPELQAQIVDGYGAVLAILMVHLRREVVEMVPIMSKVITEKEWKAEASAAMKEIPSNKLMPLLGMLLANSEPKEREVFYRAMPGPVKLLWGLVGRSQYRKTYAALFPGDPVPETI